jgi:hypothetical protein
VSITVPPPGSSSATAEDEVCRPLADAGDLADGAVGVGHQLVDQRRLAHARLPEQHAGAPVRRASSASTPVPPWPVTTASTPSGA